MLINNMKFALAMGIQEVYKNPERFRDGPDYRASRRVFPIKADGIRYVLAMPRRVMGLDISQLQDRYYTFQEGYVLGIRQRSSYAERLEREIDMLEQLDGKCAPRLIRYDKQKGIIIRLYIHGESIREFYRGKWDFHKEEEIMRETAETMVKIWKLTGKPIGDTHPKNFIMGISGNGYWTGFHTKVDESEPARGMAADAIRFLLLIPTVYRLHKSVMPLAAKQLNQRMDKEVKERIKGMIDEIDMEKLGFWFATRIHADERYRIRQALEVLIN